MNEKQRKDRRINFGIFCFLFFISCFLFFIVSCGSDTDEKQNVQTPDPKDQLNQPDPDSLNQEQIERITKIQSVFSEVYPISLEQTIINFKRNLDPDKEIAVWLVMADAYEKYLARQKDSLDLPAKKEVFKLVLLRSMKPDSEAVAGAQLLLLKETDAQEILKYYNLAEDSIEDKKDNE
jgi:hypothetical protein